MSVAVNDLDSEGGPSFIMPLEDIESKNQKLDTLQRELRYSVTSIDVEELRDLYDYDQLMAMKNELNQQIASCDAIAKSILKDTLRLEESDFDLKSRYIQALTEAVVLWMTIGASCSIMRDKIELCLESYVV